MNIRTLTLALVLPLLLAACAAPPSRYAGGGYDGRYGGYSRCADCGVVDQINRVDGERRSDGTGAVLGGIIGGVLGNQVGSGDGRRAATVAGAIAGGVAGHAIERDVRSAPRYELRIRMDDGRRVVVVQRELDGLRRGDVVRVRGNRAYRY